MERLDTRKPTQGMYLTEIVTDYVSDKWKPNSIRTWAALPEPDPNFATRPYNYKIDSGLRLEEWSHYAAKSWWVINIIVATYFLSVFWHIHCGYKKSNISPFCLPSFVTNIKQVFIFTISSRLLHFISKFTWETDVDGQVW